MALKSWSVELGLRNGQARTSKPDPTETHWMLHVFLLPCPMDVPIHAHMQAPNTYTEKKEHKKPQIAR